MPMPHKEEPHPPFLYQKNGRRHKDLEGAFESLDKKKKNGLKRIVDQESSIYRFFQHLPELLREKGVIIEKVEEVVDFEEAMKDVRRIDNMGPSFARRPRPKMSRSSEKVINDQQGIDVTSMPEFMEGYVFGTDPTMLQRLREGIFAVQATLDLHGLRLPEAKSAFMTFIKEAVRKGLSCVKVIHGRGLRSKSGPTLKNALKGWIVMAMHRKWVYAFCSARMREGGPGATIILLRRRPSKRKIKIVG